MILLIDKPKGITSFDVVRKLQKELSERKIGHAGTLDPMASGLMILGVGESTKKLKEYVGLNKTYEAEITFGIRTDTGDITGEVLEEQKNFDISKEAMEEALQEMVGVLRLPVSPYSAMKQGGEALYKKVRKGKTFIQPLRDMEVLSAVVHTLSKDGGRMYANVTFEVGSGTYVRSLAEELGKRLAAPATLSELRRTQVGSLILSQARSL